MVNTDKSIITKGFNQTESTSNPMAHAEMIAMGCKENKDWRLNDLLYLLLWSLAYVLSCGKRGQ